MVTGRSRTECSGPSKSKRYKASNPSYGPMTGMNKGYKVQEWRDNILNLEEFGWEVIDDAYRTKYQNRAEQGPTSEGNPR